MNALVLFELLVLLLIVAWAVREVITTRRLLRANQERAADVRCEVPPAERSEDVRSLESGRARD